MIQEMFGDMDSNNDFINKSALFGCIQKFSIHLTRINWPLNRTAIYTDSEDKCCAIQEVSTLRVEETDFGVAVEEIYADIENDEILSENIDELDFESSLEKVWADIEIDKVLPLELEELDFGIFEKIEETKDDEGAVILEDHDEKKKTCKAASPRNMEFDHQYLPNRITTRKPNLQETSKTNSSSSTPSCASIVAEPIQKNGDELIVSEKTTISSGRHKKSITEKSHLNDLTAARNHNEPFSCSKCFKEFSMKKDLISHVMAHKKKPFSCSICLKLFSRKDNLNAHLVLHNNKNSLMCPICGRTFALKNTLKYHTKTHDEEKPFSCSICKKSFVHKGNLNSHIMRHSPQTPLSCPVCNKHFSNKSDLKYHIGMHNGVEIFSCSICNRSFRVEQNLKAHVMRHNGERPFPCSMCDKSFFHKRSLDEHLLTHETAKPFSCSICYKIFAFKNCLKHHIVMKHHEKVSPSSSRLNAYVVHRNTKPSPVQFVARHLPRNQA